MAMNLTDADREISEGRLISPLSHQSDLPEKLEQSESIITIIDPTVLITDQKEIDDNHIKTRSKWFAVSGILYSFLACFFFVTGTFIVKEMEIDLLDAFIVRFIVQVLAVTLFVKYQRYPIWVGTLKEKWLQLVLCILNGALFLIYFIALRYLPLPDLTTLNFTRLIWTVTFGILIYKEKASLMILLAVVFTITGVIFVSQPTFLFRSMEMTAIHGNNLTDKNVYLTHDRLIGISLALATGLISGSSLLIFKQLVTVKLKPSVLLFQHSLTLMLCLILNQIYRCFLLQDKTFIQTTLFRPKYWGASLISLLQTCSTICGNQAVKREPPSVFIVLSSTEIVYSIVLQNLFTKKKSNQWVLLGSALVVISVMLIGAHKFIEERKKRIKNWAHVRNSH
jgi:drug/metabolite transporter (DMT)-like permease